METITFLFTNDSVNYYGLKEKEKQVQAGKYQSNVNRLLKETFVYVFVPNVVHC